MQPRRSDVLFDRAICVAPRKELVTRIGSSYKTGIFVNCLFDQTDKPIFDALVFAAFDCGYVPRCALEINDAGQIRIDKILAMVRSCRLGVHDLSRTELETV